MIGSIGFVGDVGGSIYVIWWLRFAIRNKAI